MGFLTDFFNRLIGRKKIKEGDKEVKKVEEEFNQPEKELIITKKELEEEVKDKQESREEYRDIMGDDFVDEAPKRETEARRKEHYKKRNKEKELSQSIKRDGVFSVDVNFIPNSYTLDGSELIQHYYRLLEKKTLGNDKRLMDDIWKYRKDILQPRITALVSFFEKGQYVASLKVFGTLIEHGQDYVDFWYGKSIDPSSFKTLVFSFQSQLQSRGIKYVAIQDFPTKRATIDDIKTNFSFA
jgi:hypothetical protein